ncbi:MAG: hypothetical protein ACE5KM_15205 [Planctomycetaceae bacterium]
MNIERRDPARRRRPWVEGGCVSGLILVVTLVSSCRKTTPSDVNGAQKKKEDCDTILRSALDMADPTKLGVTTGIDSVANRLNDWRRDCPNDGPPRNALGPDGRRLLQKLLPKAELEKRDDALFQTRDVRHLRNSLVFARIVNNIPHGQDLDQAVDLFYFVVRSMALVEDKADGLPIPVFRALLFGRGTARDRAWLFAALLRQLKIAAVVLSPQGGTGKVGETKPKPFLVGVLLDEKGELKVYLFDTRLGLPVPAPVDDFSEALPRKPATLKQFVEDPSIAASLSTEDFRYALRGEDLRRPRVGLVGHRSLFSPQMRRLFYTVGGAYKTVPYVELDGDEGLTAAVAEFGKGRWTRRDIEIWPYPEQTFQRFEAMSQERRSELTELERPFQVPIEFTVKQGKPIPGRWLNLLHKSRVMHFMGEYSKALMRYQSVRVRYPSPGEMSSLPVSTLSIVQAGNEDASFWGAVCQYERGNIVEAVKSFDIYLQSGRRWAAHARYLLAVCRASQKKYSTAKTLLLPKFHKGHPQNHGAALLRKRFGVLQARLDARKPSRKP